MPFPDQTLCLSAITFRYLNKVHYCSFGNNLKLYSEFCTVEKNDMKISILETERIFESISLRLGKEERST